ncbi:MAG: hypothetical protein M3N56_07720 [Actinomycetota bacterium]|nr:hypothetical protein [Actinomycetota bacterium]
MERDEIQLARDEIQMEREEANLNERRSEASLAEFWHLNKKVRIGLATVFLSAVVIAGTSHVIRGDMPFERSVEKMVDAGR